MKRRLALHGLPQADVVYVPRVGAAIAIQNRAALLDTILVGTLAALHDRDGRDGQRHFRDGRLEDALRPDERDSRAVEDEAPAQNLARQDLPMETGLLFQELERRGVDACVHVGGRHAGKITEA